MADVVDIGKGLKRVKVRDKRTREKLARIHEIIVEDNRVIFPASLFGAVMSALAKKKKRKDAGASRIQIEIGLGDDDEGKEEL